MIDSITMKHHFPFLPDTERLRTMGWRSFFSGTDATINRYVWNPRHSWSPSFSISRHLDGEWYSSANASLPKLLNGRNVPLLLDSEIQVAVQILSTESERLTGHSFDSATAQISRVAFTKDFFIGQRLVRTAIAKLSRVRKPRNSHTTYSGSGVVIVPNGKSPSKRVTVYDKAREVQQRKGDKFEADAANGILRLEIDLKTRSITSVRKTLGLDDRSAKYVLTRTFADHVINKAMRDLQFEAVIAPEELNLDKLINAYGLTKTRRLLGSLELARTFGPDFYTAARFAHSGRSFKRDLDACWAAGVIP